LKRRVPALEYLATWIDKRVKSDFVIDRDIILLGDFNIPSRGSSTFKAITKFGLTIPRALLGTKGTNLSRKNTYDQILHYTGYTKSIGDKGGVVDFYKNNWRVLFPKTKFPKMTKDKFTYQLSDHLPLWVSIDTWTDDEELDQMLNP